MSEMLMQEYAALQEEVSHLAREQEAVSSDGRALSETFTAAKARCDTLLAEWRAAADRERDRPQETIARLKALYLELQTCCTEMETVIGEERTIHARARALHLEWLAAQRRVGKLRQALDREFFGLYRMSQVADGDAYAAAEGDVEDVALLLHDMRTHLTMAVLAAGQICREPRSPRAARFATYLLRGLSLLQEDLAILDPPLIEPLARGRPEGDDGPAP